MTEFDPLQHPHRRFNPLIQEWVLCSPHRTQRPWQGQQEGPQNNSRPEYDPKCYLCPRNSRANGDTNEDYKSTFVFENDYSAVKAEEVKMPEDADGDELFQSQSARGKCYVICFNPKHSLTLAQLTKEETIPIVKTWRNLYVSKSKEYPWLKYLQIFENKGSAMGCSNPHPHCQTWCLSYIPSIAQKILNSFHEYASKPIRHQQAPKLTTGQPSLLLDYAFKELHPKPSDRVIFQTAHFVALVPYWATWPYEVMLIPYQRHVAALSDLEEGELEDLADCLRRITCRLDNVFQCSFPYSMGIYQRPVLADEFNGSVAQLFFSWYPPLLRSATVRKFLVGFEMFAEAQRDLTPETGAERIRAMRETHYTSGPPEI